MPASRENTGRDRAENKAKTRGARAGLICAFLAALIVPQFRALSQTVSSQAGLSTQTTPATPDASFIAPVTQTHLPFLTGAADLAQGYATPGAGTAFITPVAPAQRPLLSGAVDLAEGYTTNANGEQGTSSGKPDTFTRGGLDLGLHYGARRLTADAHYSLSGYYYSRFHDLNNLVNRLNFAGTSELIPDHLSVNVNAFAAPAVLSRVGRLTANGDLVSNNVRQSYGYAATPVLKLRLGEYALSQTSVSESAVFFSQPTASTTDPALPIASAENTNSITVAERILSSPSFGRFRWGLTGSYANTNQTTQSQQQSQGTVDLAYALDRVVALLGTFGYGQLTSSAPLTQSISGPIALAGVRYSYGPQFALVAEAGTSNGFATYLGSLNWSPTPTFNIVGSLTDAFSVPQGDILNNLSTLAVSTEGVFSDARSAYWQTQGQALFPQFATVSPVPALGLALDNSIYHSRSAQLAFVHRDERNQYGLSLFGNTRDRLNSITSTIPARSSVYGVSLQATRKLRPDLTGHAGTSYSLATEFGGHDRILTADTGLTYMMAKNLDCYVTGRYLRRESNGQIVANVPLSEFSAIIGIRRGF